MADGNTELNAQLQVLEQELQEGEITQKGYDKRRSHLLSHFLGPSKPLRTNSTVESAGNDGVARSQGGGRQFTYHVASDEPDPPSAASQSFAGASNDAPSYAYGSSTMTDSRSAVPSGLVDSSQGSRSGLRPLGHRTAALHRDSLFLPRSNSPAPPSRTISREGTMMGNYAFNPATHGSYGAQQPDDQASTWGTDRNRQSTLLDSHQNYFLNFAGHQSDDSQQRDSYGGELHRYSNSDAFSPTAAMAPPMLTASDLPPPGALKAQLPLEPRDVPFAVYDPHNPNTPMSRFDNLPSVLRYRSQTIGKRAAFWVLDQKGKEVSSITFEKLTSRAEKVAQVIRDKSNLYRGDRVALIYRDYEIVEFAVALMGCFLAGVVAVPINNQEDYQQLNVILTSTQAHLALTTDNNLKAFQRDITAQKQSWPRGVEWWKTNEFGSFHPRKKGDLPALSVPDLAYIEFSRAPTGDLRGVVLSHRTIMHQMACVSAVISTAPSSVSANDTFKTGLRDRNGKLVADEGGGETVISYLDARQGIGLIISVLLTVYGGHTTYWIEPRTVETPGMYAHLVTKYRATLMVADYPGLKRAAYHYQALPLATLNFKKGFEPNFSRVKLCLIDTLTVDSEFHEILADRWLRPMRNPRARQIVAPMLCLSEHGGMIISIRDWVGGQDRMGCPLNTVLDTEPDDLEDKEERTSAGTNGYSSLIGSGTVQPKNQTTTDELGEVLLDREALKTNEVVIVAAGDEARKRAATEPGTVRVGAFGFPIPDATLAVVDPETSLLCTSYVVGEIWVDSPSLSGGFWALPKHTQSIFHARPYRFQEDNPTPMVVEPEFLRTGLLGCVIDGKVFVLGLYEDRLRQKVEWVEPDMEGAEYRYFFVQHLVVTIMKNVPKIYDCSAFDVFVNDEHLPIVLLESNEASTNPQPSGGPPRQLDAALLDSLSERCMEALYQEHHLRVYCVMITAPNTLPRVFKNGRKEIGNMLCRREFDHGNLPCVHVKFGVGRAVMNLPVGIDPVGGIWSRLSSQWRQEDLMMQDKQYSGVDHREVVIDDRTSTSLNDFTSIVDLLQWRVARQADELALCSVDGRGKEGKGIAWKKFDSRVAAVAMYLNNKLKVRPGDHLILMYTHSEDFVFAVHACLCLGAVAIPMAPLDQNRLHEDAPALLNMTGDLGVKAILVNNDVDHLLKQKAVSQHLKQSATVMKVSVPTTFNTSKPPKQSSGCRDLGFTVKQAWVDPDWPALIWTYWTPDQRRVSIQLGHRGIMGTCKVLKETCQMNSSRPVIGCVRSTNGLGFLHTCLMGVFVGAPTYLFSPLDFAQNPASLFIALSRYKIKDTYATSQMLEHAMSLIPGKGYALHELKNLMISTEGRPRADIFHKVRAHFAATGLDRTAINTIYSHVLNPMVASQSYMSIEPIELWLDTQALQQGLVRPVDPTTDPSGLLVQDSGMVPISTQIAIVNPETCRLCRVGEYGEIWVQSEASARSFYGSKDAFDVEKFNCQTADGDPHARWVRTGDLGFLHYASRPIGPQGALVDMQILFVLGAIGETFEVNGLNHFPMDIESTVEKCHRNIVPGGSAVFQAGGLVVVLVEVIRKAFLASIVPVIVNAILSSHQLVVDIIVFVGRGDFPRSRLGEKQRGKILATWVTRKMRTIAQFGIRDSEQVDSHMQDVSSTPSRRTAPSTRNGSLVASSLGLERALAEVDLSPQQQRQPQSLPHSHLQLQPQLQPHPESEYARFPAGISEMPAGLDDAAKEGPAQGWNMELPSDAQRPADGRAYPFELPDTSSSVVFRGPPSTATTSTSTTTTKAATAATANPASETGAASSKDSPQPATAGASSIERPRLMPSQLSFTLQDHIPPRLASASSPSVTAAPAQRPAAAASQETATEDDAASGYDRAATPSAYLAGTDAQVSPFANEDSPRQLWGGDLLTLPSQKSSSSPGPQAHQQRYAPPQSHSPQPQSVLRAVNVSSDEDMPPKPPAKSRQQDNRPQFEAAKANASDDDDDHHRHHHHHHHHHNDQEDDAWRRDALLHMRYAGDAGNAHRPAPPPPPPPPALAAGYARTTSSSSLSNAGELRGVYSHGPGSANRYGGVRSGGGYVGADSHGADGSGGGSGGGSSVGPFGSEAQRHYHYHQQQQQQHYGGRMAPQRSPYTDGGGGGGGSGSGSGSDPYWRS